MDDPLVTSTKESTKADTSYRGPDGKLIARPPWAPPLWQPGKSANPGGRPKGHSILAPLLRKLAENPNEHGEGERAVAIAEALLIDAQLGNAEEIKARLALMARTDPEDHKQTVEVITRVVFDERPYGDVAEPERVITLEQERAELDRPEGEATTD